MGRGSSGIKSERAFRATQEDGTTVTIYRSGEDAYTRDIYGILNKLPISYQRARNNLIKNSVTQVSLTAAQIRQERKQAYERNEEFLRREFPGPLGEGPVMKRNGTWRGR